MAEATKIIPEAGKDYLLCSGAEQSFHGVYIGKNAVETHEFRRLLRPEGHIFVREGKGGLEVYCTRNDEEKITLMWNSDGEDGPSWPAGFFVERLDMNLTDPEKEYLREIVRRSEKQRMVA